MLFLVNTEQGSDLTKAEAAKGKFSFIEIIEGEIKL
jgi:hypothetical protein